MKSLFNSVYRGKKVLVTGHTGFKGAWLCAWLHELGADVAGYSNGIPTDPSLFAALGLERRVAHRLGDVRDLDALRSQFKEVQPSVVFHLAAQPITRYAYDIPQETFSTNVMGTVNVLECLRTAPGVEAGLMITSDKCYQNVEWTWGYRENDRLGGDDPYSASKACAENVFHAYCESFFRKKDRPLHLSSVRAGNVIGGGDWAVDRIIPDCVRAFSRKKPLQIRNPRAVRPWQHVLEPLSGYLWLGALLLSQRSDLHGESFNFGPTHDIQKSVQELIGVFIDKWGEGKWEQASDGTFANDERKEHTMLSLNCDKSLHYLNWRPSLTFEQTVQMTAEWYRSFYTNTGDLYDMTIGQIKKYSELAKSRNTAWATK